MSVGIVGLEHLDDRTDGTELRIVIGGILGIEIDYTCSKLRECIVGKKALNVNIVGIVNIVDVVDVVDTVDIIDSVVIIVRDGDSARWSRSACGRGRRRSRTEGGSQIDW